MSSPIPLSVAQIAGLAQALPKWRLSPARDAIERDLTFADFAAAFAFMAEVARHAEAMDHHPEWSNIYNRVSIRLSTHDVKGLSDKDVALAIAIDAVA